MRFQYLNSVYKYHLYFSVLAVNIPKQNLEKKIALKKFKEHEILGVNLTKEVQDLYVENSKTLLKELEDINKWKDNLCAPGLEDDTVKWKYSPKFDV